MADLRGALPRGVVQNRRRVAARVVALAGAFDLEHLGAQVGEILPGPRPGKHAREIEYTDMRQGSWHGDTFRVEG